MRVVGTLYWVSEVTAKETLLRRESEAHQAQKTLRQGDVAGRAQAFALTDPTLCQDHDPGPE